MTYFGLFLAVFLAVIIAGGILLLALPLVIIHVLDDELEDIRQVLQHLKELRY